MTRASSSGRAEIDADTWVTLHSDTSRAFRRPKSGRIAVNVMNHVDDEVLKVSPVRGNLLRVKVPGVTNA